MFGKLSRFTSLFRIYGLHAISLIVSPLIGRKIWIPLNGRRLWLNFDNATYHHLIHSISKVKRLVEVLPASLNGTIIDGGANHGVFSLLASQKFPTAKVLALEPYDKVLPVLRKNLAGTNVEIIEKALAAEDGELSFFTDPTSDQIGSVLRENVAEFAVAEANITEKRVSAISLKSLLKSQGITNIAVLKLDVQGAEFSILEHADEILAITDCLILEVVLVEKTSIELLEKANRFFPFHKALNPIAYGADIIFSKKPISI